MVKEFEGLREDEINLLLKTPAYVAILIGGADGEIDKKEYAEAVEILHLKQSKAREQLIDYFHEVGKTFQQDLDRLIKELPEDTEARTKAISTELRKLNIILPKIDKTFAIKLYASLKEFAKRIAEASGGVLGYLSVSFEESQLLDLKMIHEPKK
ncbi:MAG: hypothetical protein ACFHWX_08600 [Bacteroidota bacterium]